MDGSSPPSFTGPRVETTSDSPVNDPYNDADKGPQSFSDFNSGRPDSFTQDQPHTRGTYGGSGMKRQPTIKDMAPGRGQSYTVPSADAGNANRWSVVGDIYDGEKPKTVGDLAAEHKHNSGTVGTYPYDQEGKIPTNSDMRPYINSSGGQQGGNQFMSGPKSYNGDHFGKYTW
ncbi:unnamed protein product [Lactuca saligna]|uniref:Uncharacterized protein n=1 Tax=Lactuca saligna TaxID=75948 RepID=A0AA35VMQ3_LACSI|nr:unnamed protein product [Lactuca saligna]